MQIDIEPVLQLKVVDQNQPSLITSASGLIRFRDVFLAIADDHTYLIKVDPEKKKTELYLNLSPKPLPKDYQERKKQKPDWESLTILPSFSQVKTILVVPSGSKANRQLGHLVQIQDSSAPVSVPVNFSDLFAELEKYYPELNIEGSAVVGDALKLFQRGNGSLGQNAVIDLDLPGVLADIINKTSIKRSRLKNIRPLNLGELNGSRLSFTDACSVNERVFFLAVAEESNSTFEDGAYKGAVLGCLNKKGNIEFKLEINCPQKPEGLWIEAVQQDQYQFWIVTDADSPDISSMFYKGNLITV